MHPPLESIFDEHESWQPCSEKTFGERTTYYRSARRVYFEKGNTVPRFTQQRLRSIQFAYIVKRRSILS